MLSLPGRAHLCLAFALAAFCAAFALPTRALADNTADEAGLRFDRGVAFYKARQYENALAEFFQSNRLVRNNNVILNIARCYEQLGRMEEAYRYYAEFLEGAGEGQVRKIAEDGIARISPRVALLKVESSPVGANIYIGRKDLGAHGVTPRTLALPPGATKVILELPGHEDASRELTLTTGGQVETGAVELRFITGKLKLSGTPEGAQIRVNRTDGEAACVLPCALDLAPGTPIIHVQAEGFFPAQLPVDLKADAEVALNVELQALPPATGAIRVTSNHEGALVEIDGHEVGFTPLVSVQPVGVHKVRVTMPDMRPVEREVSVEKDAHAWVQADLRFAGAKTTAASKTETSVDEAPASVTVISRAELRAFGYTSLPEALRGVRGLFFSNDRSYEFIGVRGFSPPGDFNTRVLILYDGHPVNDIFAAQSYLGRDFNVDLNEVERIEVVRGPVSSLFGSAAFFGVINVVSRTSLDKRHVEVNGMVGSQETIDGRVTGAHKGQNFEVIGSAAAYRSSGDSPMIIEPDEGDGLQHVLRGRDKERTFNGTLRARLGDFSLLGYINDRRKEIPTGAYGTAFDLDGTHVKDLRAFVEARYDRESPWGTLAARLYYDATRYSARYMYFEDEEARTGSLAQNEKSYADWLGLELRYRSPVWFHQNVTVGLEYQYQARVRQLIDVLDAAPFDVNATLNIVSAYLADEIRIGSRFIVNASARFDAYLREATPATGTTSGIEASNAFPVNPRLALIARSTPGGITKLMGGSSFRAPSSYELYYEDGTSQLANPEGLDSERIWTIELEHTQEIYEELKFVVSGYVNWIDNLIYARDNGEGLLTYENYRPNDKAYGVRTEGAEVELRWQPGRLTMLSAAYWYQHMSIASDDGEAAFIKANAPSHAFSAKAMFPILAPMLVASIEGVFNSSRLTVDGQTRTGETFWLNLGLSGELPSGHFRYFAGVKNLLDDKSRMPSGGDALLSTIPGYGRTFQIMLTGSY